ncbi:GNAT family N-acetyltransferase [Chloroflexota bacterium]
MYHPFLIGEKVYLRGLEREDLEGNYFQWLNDYEVTRLLASGTFPNSREAMEEYLTRMRTSGRDIFFAIVEKETDRHIGNLRVGDIDWIRRTASIGQLIGEKDCWGKGYGTEALKLAVEYCFNRLNLHKIVEAAASSATAAIKYMEKLGFVLEGTLRKEAFIDGEYQDALRYGLLREDYKF